jgi:hypothetical protein
MIEFLNPLLLGGLAAVSAPIIIHLLHRRKVKVIDWGAMRFLLEMMARSRRRLFLEELLLLLLRALIIACIALAMIRPALNPASGANREGGHVRRGGTASILLVDDSPSCSAGRAQPALETMKKLGTAYLDSLAPGDEVSVLPLSQLGASSTDPVFDLEGVKAHISDLRSSFVASDIPALLESGLNQVRRHINPGVELVVLTDGRRDGWRLNDKVRWDSLRERLDPVKPSAKGTRRAPRVLVLSPVPADADDNLGITNLNPDRTLVSANRPAGLRVTAANFGKSISRSITVQVRVNGEVIGSKRTEVPANSQQQVVFTHTFGAPGSYAIEADFIDNQDSLPADDHRAVSIQVENSVPVLLVEGAAGTGLQSKLGFLEYALTPDPDNRGAFRVTRIPITHFNSAMLQDFRVVVLGDLALLEPSMVDALERYVVGGGGVLVGLGPGTDGEFMNRYFARNGEGFLPCPLLPPVSPAKAALPATINQGHPIFSAFGSRNDEAWKEARVRSYYKVDSRNIKPSDLAVLLALDNGDPLVLERARGLGLVILACTSLNADWTDLPLQAAYVPLLRGIIGHLGSFVLPPRNLRPGDRLFYAKLTDPAQTLSAEDPQGKPVRVGIGSWEGRNALVSEPLMMPGLYTIHDPKEPQPIRFAVSVDPAESTLAPVSDREINDAFNGRAALFHSPDQIAQQLDPTRRQSVELWKWLVLAAVVLLFVEGYLTRREARTSS